MPRVTSQETRQFILVTGDPLDLDGPLPDKIELFNEAGNPLMIGVGGTRTTLEHITASLASDAREASSFEWYPSVRLIQIATDRAARVRMYATAAQRDADLTRTVGTKPTGNHGRLLEFVTTASELSWYLTPVVDMSASDPDDPVYYITVDNLSGSTHTVRVTFTYIRTE